MVQERELIDLKAANVRMHDAEVVMSRELEQLRERNAALLNEADAMRRQLKAQEEAILGA